MTQTYKERAANLPTGLWSCDANGSPCDAYTARWKMEDLAAEADAAIASRDAEIALLRSLFHQIDNAAVALPTFEIRFEGGEDAAAMNIACAIGAANAEIARLREEMARAYELIVLGSVQARKLERDQYLRQAATRLDAARKKG